MHFEPVLKFLREYCVDGSLVRYDYAIDVPVSLDDVLVVSSRKERGLYRGTRYLGRRHAHGYCKIYDKGAEQHEDVVLTRIEYTFDPRIPPAFDNIMIRGGPSEGLEALERLSGVPALYLDMLIEIRALGGQIEPYINRINSRTWKKIEPHLFSGVQLIPDSDIINQLVNVINNTFIITDTYNNVNDSNDFLEFTGSVPWEL